MTHTAPHAETGVRRPESPERAPVGTTYGGSAEPDSCQLFSVFPDARAGFFIVNQRENNRLRDTVLGILSDWQFQTYDPETKRRLGEVIRAARQRCGGAYVQWQNLLDRKYPEIRSSGFINPGAPLTVRASLIWTPPTH